MIPISIGLALGSFLVHERVNRIINGRPLNQPIEVSITNNADQYVDLTGKANSPVFNIDGSLIVSAAAIIGALTVANRISVRRRAAWWPRRTSALNHA